MARDDDSRDRTEPLAGASGEAAASSVPDLFAEGLELAVEERASWLAELSRREPEIAAEVTSLLEASHQGDRWIARPLAAREALVDPSPPAQPARVGPFRLEKEIGRGGMGRVFLAHEEREAFERRVALKLLDTAHPSPEAVKRFRAEVRLLAALEHPGIARFLDGGQSADGTWYLALEYVEGRDLLRDAEARNLDVRSRLRLFLEVLSAVAYAHERQVVHRDLKPGNILVDRAGRAHLLDFGISKLMGEPGQSPAALAPTGLEAGSARPMGISGAATTRTELGLLTPAYASPEQIRGGPVGPASDIYSLGVVLYELLAREHPYGGARSSQHEIERAALAGELEPPSTAARRSIGRGAKEDASLSANRRLRVSRDLDAICLKALHLDPGQRYESVAEFARDVEFYLAGRPVVARRGGWHYRAFRAARRHQGWIAAAATLTAAVGLTVALQHRIAGLEPSPPAAPAAPTPKPFPFSSSDTPLEELERRFAAEPGSFAAGADLAASLLRADRVREAALVVSRLRQIPGGDDDPLVDYVDGALASERSEPQRALALYSQALATALARGRGELVGQIRAARGRVLSILGRREEGGREMELARADFEAAGDLSSLSRVLNDLAIDAAQRNELARAEELFERALAATKAASPENTGATFLGNLAHVAALQGRLEVAERRYREVQQIFHELDRPGREATQLEGLTTTLWLLGRAGEAQEAIERSIELARRHGDASAIAQYVYTRARLLAEAGTTAGVEESAAEIERQTEATGLKLGLAMADDLRGRLLLLAGKFPEGTARLEESLGWLREAGAEDSFAGVQLTLAEGRIAAADFAGAEGWVEQAMTPLRGAGERIELTEAEVLLARIELLSGRRDAARSRLDRWAPVAEHAQHVDLRQSFLLGRALLERSEGRLADASKTLTEARSLALASGRRSRAAEIEIELAGLALASGRREAGRRTLDRIERDAAAAGWGAIAERARSRSRGG